MNNPYTKLILEHYQNPHYHALLEAPDFVSSEVNPACGDAMHVMGKVQNGILTALSVQGTGCVLSQAAGSLLAEHVINKPVAEILALPETELKRLAGDYGLGRMRCITLALDALKTGLAVYAR